VSIAAVAVGLAAHRLGDLAQRRAVVIGTGENGELTGRVLSGHGAKTVFVAHRRHDRARTRTAIRPARSRSRVCKQN
jgi:glutamyl-tRNA reductase